MYLLIFIILLQNTFSLSLNDESGTVILPLPPKNLMFMVDKSGYLDFLQIGYYNLQFLKEFGLKIDDPGTHLLDMGSGYGRLLSGIIIDSGKDFKGNYTGMEILKRHVTWCQHTYAKYYPEKVNFIHLDVYNSRYNPTGVIQPSALTIPALSNYFSFISLFSVFTHMHESDIFNYLSEFKRILRPNGVIVGTIFTYNSKRLQRAIATGYGAFEYNDHTRIKNKIDPLFAIVFEETWFIQNLVSKSGLVLEKIVYGNAIGDPDGVNHKLYPQLFQDLFVLKKPV